MTPTIDIVTREQLEALAAELSPPPSSARPAARPTSPPSPRTADGAGSNSEYTSRLDVRRWLVDRRVDYREEPRDVRGFTTFHIVCPFDASHNGTDCAIMQHESGAMSAKCFHESCRGRDWQLFKQAIGKPDSEHYDPPPSRSGRRKRSTPPARPAAASANGVAASSGAGLDSLVTSAVAREMTVGERPTALEANDDPHRLARIIHVQHYRHRGVPVLRFHRGEWHIWDGQAYRITTEHEIRGVATAAIKAEFDRLSIVAQEDGTGSTSEKALRAAKVTIPLVSNVLNALRSEAILPSKTEAPAWLDNRQWPPPREVLACSNGLIHLPSVLCDQADFRITHTPLFFSPNSLDYDFEFDPPPPAAWLDFLSKLWPNDHASIDTLQEWTGNLLLPDTSQQKILMLIGPKRSGKGTIARIMTALIGQNNVAAPTLSSLGTNFGLAPLIGKLAAIISDARLSGRTDVAVLTERLLSISGEDAQTIDRKNLSHWTGKLSTRFMILTNELPNLADASGALPSRVILLQLSKSWYGMEDSKLTDRLLVELPSILRWAIDGWKRLQERGHFVQPPSGRDLFEEMTDLASPVKAFVDECCILGDGASIEKSVLYEAFKRWCERQGRNHTWDAPNFGKRLLAAVPSVKTARLGERDNRVYQYQGIHLK